MEYGQPSPSNTGGKKERPTSITILAILYILAGVMWIGMGAFFGIVGLDFLPALGAICFAVPAILGVLYLVIAIGLWTGQNWARMVAIIFAVIGLLGFPIGTIISIIILILLFKDNVKAYFKENTQPHTQQQQWQQSQQQKPQQQFQKPSQPQQQPQQKSKQCPGCGGQMRYIDEYDRWYCDNCQEYKSIEEETSAPSEEQQKNACPDCGDQMRYMDEYDRWYCDSCQEYK